MQVRSNRLGDIILHYKGIMTEKFSDQEIAYVLNWLLEYVTKIPSTQIALHHEDRVNESDLLKIHFGVKDLMNDKPIQHIVGEVEFLDCHLEVSEHVLIPRPETEELVNLIVHHDFKPASILDIGTGSGAIAIALNKALDAHTTAIEEDAEALTLAIHNALKNKARVRFVKQDFLDYQALLDIDFSFDLIVSNPPYVRNLEKEKMHANVLDYEPHKALFVDDDNPLVFYKAIAAFAKPKLAKGGHIWLEINEYLANETAALFEADYAHVEIIKDFRDRDRFIHVY